MRYIIYTVFLLFFVASFSFTDPDAKTLVVHGDTLWFKNLTQNDSIQLTKTGGSAQTWTNKTLGTGSVWNGNAISDQYISSASTWNAKQGAITTGTTAQYLRGDLTLATFPTTTASFANSTDKNFVTDAKLIVINNTSGTNTGDQTTVSGNAGTATILQNSRLIDGVSFNGSADIATDNDLLAYQALGSPILAETVGQKLFYSNVATALTDGQIKFTAVYLPKATTLTGIKIYSAVQGSYTGDNNNRIGLYSYSGGNLTLVASSVNNANLWTASANTIQTIAFSSTYAAAAGIYYVGILYNQSAQVTAPSVASGIALSNVAKAILGFTNSAKLFGTANGADLTTPIAMSAITTAVIPIWVGLY